MKTIKARLTAWLLGVGWVVFQAGCANNLPPQVLVVGDLTPLGKASAPPDAEHPVYYYPLVVDYREMGATYAREPAPPKKDEVSHTLAVALAKQNYFLATMAH